MATRPAEKGTQARYLYGGLLGSALVAAATERGWTAEASPHTLRSRTRSPLIGADEQPGQQVPQLPAFIGIGDSGRSDISEHADDLLAGGFGE